MEDRERERGREEDRERNEKAIALIRQVQTTIYYYSGGRDATENETAYYIKIVCTHPSSCLLLSDTGCSLEKLCKWNIHF